MNNIVSHLIKLNKLNPIAVKQSLEDEGASFDDLISKENNLVIRKYILERIEVLKKRF